MEPSAKKKRLKLDPDLTDGQSWTVQDEANDVLMKLISEWKDNANPGEAITIELVEMTDDEVAAMPDI